MKKKLLKFVLALACLALTAGFAGCGEKDKKCEHIFTNYVSNGDATCTKDGTKTAECDNACGETDTVTDEGSATGKHNYVKGVCDGCGRIKPSEGLCFSKNSGGASYSVTGIGDCVDSIIVIPDTYNEFPVTEIGIAAFSGCSNITEIIIPNSVTYIGYEAFYDCYGLTEIVIPDKVKNIGPSTFYQCYGLTEIVIPDSVTNIGSSAFYSCFNLMMVTIGENSQLVNIGNSAFEGCTNLTEMVIPSGVTNIGSSAFESCSNLTEIVLPNNLKSIGSYAFHDCQRFTEIVIPDSVSSLEKCAFENCGMNVIYCKAKSLPSGWSEIWNVGGYNKYFPVVWDCNNNDVADDGYIYAVVDGIRYALKDDFATVIRQSKNLEIANIFGRVVYKNIEYTVTSINTRAFALCDSLTSVVIPNSVTSIGDNAVSVGVTTIYCEAKSQPSGWSSSWNGNYSTVPVVWDCNNNDVADDGYIYMVIDGVRYALKDDFATVIRQSKNLEIANIFGVVNHNNMEYSVTSIGNYAFRDCSRLTEIVIPDSVTSIGDWAFYSCDSLTEIVIPDSVTSIGDWAFRYCDSLTEIVIPDSVTSIGDSAFRYCDSLTEIVIPDSVTSIGEYAFSNCDSLTEIVIPDNVTSIGEHAFYDCDSLTSVEVSDSNTEYKSIDGNLYSKDGKTLIQYAIGKTAMSFTIPDSVTSIGDSAFYSCDSLTEIVIPDSVTSIGNYAFYDCDRLENVVIGDGVISIGEHAFRYCDSLTRVEIPDNVTSIGNYAFDGCSRLTEIVIPDSVTSIGDWAFSNCDSLTEIVIPDSVTSIGSDAFGGCDGLEGVYITDLAAWCNISFEGILSNPLYYAKKLYLNNELVTKLEIPNTVTEIKDHAFGGYESMTEIVIPDSVTSIGLRAFYNCDGLTSVEIPDSVTSIGDWAFDGCDSLTEIVIPDNVTSIGNDVFYDCNSLTIYCEAESRPSSWDFYWNYSYRPVYWYSESKPAVAGNYWHYGENGEIVVWEYKPEE